MRRYLGVLVLATCVIAAAARAEYEGATFGVERFGAFGECCSNCSDLSYPADEASKARDALLKISYSTVRYNSNAGVDGRDWMDASLFPGTGKDRLAPYGTDWADAVFYSGHGSRLCSSANGYYSSIVMGAANAGSGETCSPNTKTHMRFGEGASSESDLNVLILNACQSVHRCV